MKDEYLSKRIRYYLNDGEATSTESRRGSAKDVLPLSTHHQDARKSRVQQEKAKRCQNGNERCDCTIPCLYNLRTLNIK